MPEVDLPSDYGAGMWLGDQKRRLQILSLFMLFLFMFSKAISHHQ